MGSRSFTLMAIVFLVIGGAYWWFNLGPGRPDAGFGARSLSVQEAWPGAVQMVRPGLRDATDGVEHRGVPRILAPIVVVIGVLLAGYVIAWILLQVVRGLFTGSGLIASLFQVVIVPLWQIGLTLISAMQTVEWVRDKGLLGGADATTPAFVGYAIVSLVMMYGLSRVRVQT